MKSPFPFREQPETPRRLGSILWPAVLSNASIRRDTPHAQPVVAPVFMELPYKSKNFPFPREALFCCAAISSLPKVMLPTPAGIGMLTPPIPMIAGYGAVPLVGVLIVAEKVMDFPPSVTVTDSFPAE